MKTLSLSVVLSSLAEIGSTVLVIALCIFAVELLLWVFCKKIFKMKNSLAIMLIAPAALGLFVLIVLPVCYEFGLAFSNMNLLRFRNPTFGLEQGLNNFRKVFFEPILKSSTFLPLFLRTFLWTFIQITFHVAGGLALALLLNKKIKFRGFFRTLLVFPWAVPQIIATLAWRGEFHYDYGFVNIMLRNIGLAAIQWKSDPFWNFVAINIVNIWLGIPFMMVTLLGGLQSIDSTYYEAAEIDGATPFQRFTKITLPLLQPVLTPSVVYGIIWTFNNFNVPFFINENELESSDILVTALFRAAFEYNQYGFAAAFALVVFLILLAMTVIYMKVSNFKPVVKKTRLEAQAEAA